MTITYRTPFPDCTTERDFSLILCRFSKPAYLEEFRDGYLFLNTENYFAKLKNDAVRSDPFEGITKIVQPAKVRSIRLESKETEKIIDIGPEHLRGPVRLRVSTPRYNILCMYSLPTDWAGLPNVDPRWFESGAAFTFVLDTQEFLNRIQRAALEVEWGMDCNLVEYYDPDTYTGDVGSFRKPLNFAYQREFRILISADSTEAIRLRTESLRDITTPIYPLHRINSLVQLNSISENEDG